MQHFFFKIRSGLFALVFLGVLSVSAHAGEIAGAVSFVVGDASVLGETGAAHALVRGENLNAGQIVVTGSNGHVHLRMVDGAFVSVRPASRLRIEEYHYDAANASNSRIKFILEQGVARSITGRAGEASKESYRLNTPLAAIGIRGTDFVVQAESGLTRVVVQSGAIVMSPLSADCLASALGPCKTVTARVLTAAMRDAYLELRSRNDAPMLVPAEKALESPNLLSPPRPEEPRAGSDKAAKASGAPVNYAVDANRAAAVDNLKTHVDAIVVPPVDVVKQPEVASKIWWGRWESFAGNDGRTLKSVLGPDREGASSNPVFGLLREVGDVVLPGSGVAKFKLAESESYLMGADKSLSAAKINAPSLMIDFGNRRYDTALTVSANGVAPVDIQSSGSITFQGYFISESNSPGTTVDGALSRNGDQAGYLFQRLLSGGASVIGATRWIR